MQSLCTLKDFPQISLDCTASNLSPEQAANPLLVLHSVAHVFNISLSLSDLRPVTIILDLSMPNPICYRSLQKIYLTSSSIRWSQMAYQFAHELCHYVIPSDVTSHLCWLEESICELSSYYFLPKISKYWKRLGISLTTTDGEPYYPFFTSYVEDDQKKAVRFDLASFCSSAHVSPDLSKLMKNCEIRYMNAYIANELLPIFRSYPKTWHAIPLMASLRSDVSLEASLEEWIALSPEESRIGLRKIAQIFGAKISL